MNEFVIGKTLVRWTPQESFRIVFKIWNFG